MKDRKPVLVRCPVCQPGPYSFAGVIVAAVLREDEFIAGLTYAANLANEQTAALRAALEVSTGELEYWLKTYRSHSGFMNATHLMEQEALTKRVAANRALLAAPDRALSDYERRPTAGRCRCGLREVPAGCDGVQWYWARHTREGCALELPNVVCWCGLTRAEHQTETGHDAQRGDGRRIDAAHATEQTATSQDSHVGALLADPDRTAEAWRALPNRETLAAAVWAADCGTDPLYCPRWDSALVAASSRQRIYRYVDAMLAAVERSRQR